MDEYFDLLVKRAEMLGKWEVYVKKLSEAAKHLLPDARVYVFGSVVEDRLTGGSDVDVLVVSHTLPKSELERADLKLKLEELVGLPTYHPFEIHLASEDEARLYFKKAGTFKLVT